MIGETIKTLLRIENLMFFILAIIPAISSISWIKSSRPNGSIYNWISSNYN